MLNLVLMHCLDPLYPYQQKQGPTISMRRPFDVIYVKMVKKNILTIKILGTYDFHRVFCLAGLHPPYSFLNEYPTPGRVVGNFFSP